MNQNNFQDDNSISGLVFTILPSGIIVCEEDTLSPDSLDELRD